MASAYVFGRGTCQSYRRLKEVLLLQAPVRSTFYAGGGNYCCICGNQLYGTLEACLDGRSTDMGISEENKVLCGANSYSQKYYLNPEFDKLPEQIKDELKIMCVLFTEDIGGVLTLLFDSEGELKFNVDAADEDYLFDEIGCGLKIKDMQIKYRELLESVQLFYKVMILKDPKWINELKRSE